MLYPITPILLLKLIQFNYISEGGGSANPAINSALRSAVEEALRRDVSNSTIQTTLKKCSQMTDDQLIKRQLFELRLYNKVFVVFVIYTTNLAQAKIQLGTIFRKHKADVTNTKHMFTERGVIDAIARPEVRASHFEDDCTTDAIECGADDVEIHDAAKRQLTFICDPVEINRVKQKITALGYQIEYCERSYIPNTIVTINEAEKLDYAKFQDKLEAIDGFDDIFDNIEDDEDDD